VYETARFRLSGLDSEARYLLTDLESNETEERTGRELADGGLPVAVRTQPGTAVITDARIR